MRYPGFCNCCLCCHCTICVDSWNLLPSRLAIPCMLHATQLSLSVVHAAPVRTTSPTLSFCIGYALCLHVLPQLFHRAHCKTHPCTCSLLWVHVPHALCFCTPCAWLLRSHYTALPCHKESTDTILAGTPNFLSTRRIPCTGFFWLGNYQSCLLPYLCSNLLPFHCCTKMCYEQQPSIWDLYSKLTGVSHIAVSPYQFLPGPQRCCQLT